MRATNNKRIAIIHCILISIILVFTAQSLAAVKFSNEREQGAYVFPAKAFDDGLYDEAIEGFQSYLSLFPNGAMRQKAEFFIALSYYLKKDYAAAKKAFDILLKENLNRQDEAQALYWLGQTLLALNSFEKAAQAFGKSFEDNPASDPALFQLGWSLKSKGDSAASIETFKKLEVLFPESDFLPQAQYLLGELHFGLKDYGRAADRFSYILKHYPKFDHRGKALFQLAESQYNLARYRPAKERYLQYLKEFPGGQFVTFARYGLGWSAYMSGDYKAASEQFQKVLGDAHPEELTAGASYIMAKSNVKLKNNDKAAHRYLAFIRSGKAGRWLEEAYVDLGYFFYTAASYAISSKIYEKASLAALNEDSRFLTKYMLGQNYFYMGQYKKALENYREAAKLGKYSDYSAEILYKTALSLANLGRFEEAIAIFNEFDLLHPTSSSAAEAAKVRRTIYARLADAEMKKGEFTKAIDYYNMLADAKPIAIGEQGVVAFKIGLANFQLGNHDRALAQFKTSLANPSLKSDVRAEALFLLGRFFVGRGDCQKAARVIGVFSREYASSSRAPEADYLSAACAEKLGVLDKATAGYLASSLGSDLAMKARLRAGLALLKGGKSQSAARHLQVASTSSEDAVRAESDYWLAEAYAGQGDIQKALTHLEKVWREIKAPAPWPELAKLKAASIYEGLSRWKEAELLYGEVASRTRQADIKLKAEERLGALKAHSKAADK